MTYSQIEANIVLFARAPCYKNIQVTAVLVYCLLIGICDRTQDRLATARPSGVIGVPPASALTI